MKFRIEFEYPAGTWILREYEEASFDAGRRKARRMEYQLRGHFKLVDPMPYFLWVGEGDGWVDEFDYWKHINQPQRWGANSIT